MIGGLITIFLYVLVFVILYMLIEYLIKTIPIIDPMAKILRIAATVIFTLVVVLLILGLLGVGDVPLPRIR